MLSFHTNYERLHNSLLLARLMGTLVPVVYCRRCRRLCGFITLPASGSAGRHARRRSGGRHSTSTAGQYGYVPLGRHFVLILPRQNVTLERYVGLDLKLFPINVI